MRPLNKTTTEPQSWFRMQTHRGLSNTSSNPDSEPVKENDPEPLGQRVFKGKKHKQGGTSLGVLGLGTNWVRVGDL